MQNEIHLDTRIHCPFNEQRVCGYGCALYVSSSGRCSFKDIAHTLKEILGSTTIELKQEKILSQEAYQRLMKLGE